MCDDGATTVDVAAKLKIPAGTIASWRADARKRAAGGAAAPATGMGGAIDMAKATRAVALRQGGMSITKVADKYGVSTSTIYAWCKRVRDTNGAPPARTGPKAKARANGHAPAAPVPAPGHSPADALLATRTGGELVMAPRTAVGYAGPPVALAQLERQVRALTLERDALRRALDELTK